MPKKPRDISHHKESLQVQIQFGLYKGKILRYHNPPACLRPTLARARDVLFNWLPQWQGLSCWDLFAGTGILGIQSLCLGAKHVSFVETQLSLRTQLQTHLRAMNLDSQARCFDKALPAALESLPESVDRVFMDPPFGHLELYYEIAASEIFAAKLAKDAIIYVELPQTAMLSPFQKIIKQKQLGDVSIYLVHDSRNLS
jgi:16S rRNA (guanine966-N2)-methyltransferase